MAALPSSSSSLTFPSGAAPVCVSVTGTTVDELQRNAAAFLPCFTFLELRLDYLADPLEAVSQLGPFLKAHPQARFLGTCRPERSGGRMRGLARDEMACLQAAAKAGCAIIDLSLETAEELGRDALQQLRSAGAAVLLSFHDFVDTPDPEGVLARMRPFQPDLYKVVTTALNLDDSLAMIRLLRSGRSPGPPLVGIAMGEPGLLTRVLGPRSGAAFTFAAATEAEATAPGQLTAQTLQDLYRIGHLSKTTRLFGVAGDPIRTSLSPLMLNTAFRETAFDAVYLPLKTQNAEELFRVARELPLDGFSVTMPLKQAILPLLNHIDPLAVRIGAVNTVHRTPQGEYHGYNTDAAGIVVPLEQRIELRGARILVLGAGGAARAAVFGCKERGAEVSLYNRTPETAQALAREADATALSRNSLATETFDVLINSTPAGMSGNALVLPLEERELRAKLVFDLVYNPLETPLLALARAKGLQTIAGVEMFVNQGARQFEVWTGQQAPAAVMQQVVLQALQARTH